MDHNNPVVAALEALERQGEAGEAERFILAHGRAFQPVPLLKEIRKRKTGQCHRVAGGLALQGVGFSYVEGFVIGPGVPDPIQHAWVTSNGTDAIDPSSRQPGVGHYFGVVVPVKVVARAVVERGHWALILPEFIDLA